jgi:CBS domain-containing protein
MDLIGLAEKPLVFDSEDTVSKAVSKMHETGKDVAVVLNGGKYAGVLIARELSKRKINNPDETKIKNFIHHIDPISPASDLNDVIHSIIVNDYKSVPVKDNSNILILSKISILKHVKNGDVFRNKTAEDVMVKPFCITSTDTLAVAITTLRDTGVTRLPVVDRGDRIEGLVDTIGLLNADIKRRRARKGERAGEKIKLGDIFAESFMEKNVMKIGPEAPLREAINKMAEHKSHTVLIEKDGKLAGLITPKLLLRLMAEKAARANVRISGLQKEDPFLKDIVKKDVQKLTDKLEKMMRIDSLVVDIDRHHEEGKRVKYSIRVRTMTGEGFFFAKSHAWDLTKAVKEALERLEREVLHKKEKRETERENTGKW